MNIDNVVAAAVFHWYVFLLTDAATITTGNSITITLNTDQDLVCTADANPRPDGFVTWTREGFDISMHTALFRDGNGVLQIQNVSKSDAGMYTCHADNGIEPAAKTDINVIIQCKYPRGNSATIV